MSQPLPFRYVLEAADHLSHDEQEELVAILHRRLAQAARERLADDIRESRQEFAEGRCSPVTPDELMIGRVVRAAEFLQMPGQRA